MHLVMGSTFRGQAQLFRHIKLSWLESDSVYGYRKVADELRYLGETFGKHRVCRLMGQENPRS